MNQAPEITGRGWLGTGGQPLSLKQLRGKVVLLDFWTFCCINCLHVLDELRQLEQRFAESLVIIGIHSPKFSHETQASALAGAVQRYQVNHPVLDDPDLTTWQAYGARAWPTLVLIDPEGQVVAHLSGEGHGAALAGLIEKLVASHEISAQAGPYQPSSPPDQGLLFPARVICLPSQQLLIADAGAHRLVGASLDGGLVSVIGSGQPGWQDGIAAEARFRQPNGMCLLPADISKQVGYDVVVADTANQVLRGLNLAQVEVQTVAGTGQQRSGALPGPALAAGGGPATDTELSSPWDVAFDPVRGLVLVAMAGVHQIWGFDPVAGLVGVLAGTSAEGLLDGPGELAWLAQPSGLAVEPSGRCWFVDSETSALRWLDLDNTVHTAVGQGLFEFGLVDGDATTARMQHPLGLALSNDGQILVADTYNGAIRL
ncbi:MAG: redoxin domain-containing protein [Micrococcales bacterium]|nr:redoxin domain-containing protein [Micrococcales bacterium]